MRFLSGYRGALLVVSHDIALLDASITRILHLDRDGVVEYRGTYTAYREARAADEVRLAALATRQEAEIKRLKTLADSMRGQTAKRARTLDTRGAPASAQGRRPEARTSGAVPVPGSAPLGPDAARRRGPHEGVRGPAGVRGDLLRRGARRTVARDGSERCREDEPAPILADETRPDAGSHRLGHGAQLGYYAQEHEGIRDGLSVLAHMHQASRADDQALRTLLGMFGLHGEMAFQDAGTLSGGEKTKLALAQLVAGRKNLLLLDEPTNNLDPRRGRRSRTPSATGRGDGDREPRHRVRGALAPERVLMMPEGGGDHWTDDLLDLVALA